MTHATVEPGERLVDQELGELLDRIEELLGEVRQRVAGAAVIEDEGGNGSNGD